jgi:hypothetical protein
MSTHTESHPLADVIEHFASAEQRNWNEVEEEMNELAALYRNVMHSPLPEISDNFTTTNRIEALRVMRHYLPNDETFDDEKTPAKLAA